MISDRLFRSTRRLALVACALLFLYPIHAPTQSFDLASPLHPSATQVTATLQLPDAEIIEDQETEVALTVTLTEGSIQAAELEIHYDSDLFEAVAATLADALSGWLLAANLFTPGEIRIALAGSTALGAASPPAPAALVKIRFKAIGDPERSSPLTLTRGELNEGQVSSALIDGNLLIRFQTFELAAALAGNGNGRIQSVPEGIDCGTTCAQTYIRNTPVTLTAIADADSDFAGWSGDCAGSEPVCLVTLDQARSVTATFTLKTYPLSITKAGNGAGTISADPGAIECGTTCLDTYDHGTLVTLNATPTFGSEFTAWSGDCAGSDPICQVTLDQARSVTATFTLKTYSLNVVKTGNGTGTVSADPGTIECGPTCSGIYDHGTRITLSATPALGSEFTAWSGDCLGSSSTCEVTLDQARSVTATFSLERYRLSGHVTFWNASRPISGTHLALSGDVTAGASTDEDGVYAFDGLTMGDYSVAPIQGPEPGFAISAYDASLVLRHAAGLELLSGDALIAADANQSGTASAYDASLMLQYAAGLIQETPFAGASNAWLFTPPHHAYGSLVADHTNQDFTAILLGDPSGNWSDAEDPSGMATATEPRIAPMSRHTQETSATLSMPLVTLQTGQVFEIPLTLDLPDAQQQVQAIDLEIHFDPAVITQVDVAKGARLAAWQMAVNLQAPGVIRVALAGTDPLVGSQSAFHPEESDPERIELLMLDLSVIDEYGAHSALRIQRGDLDEGRVPVSFSQGSVRVARPGDLNADNSVNALDVALAVRLYLGRETGIDADMNEDKRVDVLDVLSIIREVLKHET